jgi:hypothetical protein
MYKRYFEPYHKFIFFEEMLTSYKLIDIDYFCDNEPGDGECEHECMYEHDGVTYTRMMSGREIVQMWWRNGLDPLMMYHLSSQHPSFDTVLKYVRFGITLVTIVYIFL